MNIIRESTGEPKVEPSSEFFNTRRAVQRMLEKAETEHREQLEKLQRAAMADTHGGEQ